MQILFTGGALLAVASSLVPGESKSSCSAMVPAAKVAETGSIVETAASAGSFQTLVQALKAAHLVGALEGPGPFTVFAPTDEAFARLPAGTLENLLEPENVGTLETILTYHVVAGEVLAEKVVGMESATALNGQRLAIAAGKDGVRVAGARVVKTDVACTNGVIHVVDQVMMPATKNLVATAIDAGQFTILARALGAGGLVEALSGKGPFTVFAPTDEAFGKLPEKALEGLLAPEGKDRLVAILKYHVVPGRVYSDQLSHTKLETLNGAKLPIELGGSGVSIGGAGVLQADLETTNGVIHVIDQVLMPGA